MRNPLALLAIVGLLPWSAAAGIAFIGDPGDEAARAQAQRERDLRALEALGSLPKASRVLALAGAMHPDLVEEIARIHRETSGSFRGLAVALPGRSEALWEIVRHPGVIDALAATRGARDWPAALAPRLSGEPESLRSLVLELVAESPEIAAELVALRSLSRERIDAVLAPHSLETQVTFHALLAQPDLLALLTEHTQLAAALGALYRRDREAVDTLLASVGDLTDRLPEVDAEEESPAVLASADAPAPIVPVSFVLETRVVGRAGPAPVPIVGLGGSRFRPRVSVSRTPQRRAWPGRARRDWQSHARAARAERLPRSLAGHGWREDWHTRGGIAAGSLGSDRWPRGNPSVRGASRFHGWRALSRSRSGRGGRRR